MQQGEGSIKPNLSTDLHTVSAITDYHENKVKYKREDTEHYTELSKMRQRRLIIDANEIHVPTLIIWEDMIKAFHGKTAKHIINY